jgi:hypothetical protein
MHADVTRGCATAPWSHPEAPRGGQPLAGPPFGQCQQAHARAGGGPAEPRVTRGLAATPTAASPRALTCAHMRDARGPRIQSGSWRPLAGWP